MITYLNSYTIRATMLRDQFDREERVIPRIELTDSAEDRAWIHRRK